MKLLNSLLAGIFFLGIVTANAADVVDTAVKAGKFKTLVEPAGLFDDFNPEVTHHAIPHGTLGRHSVFASSNREKTS